MIFWKETKRLIRLWLRVLKDWKSGEYQKFARTKTTPSLLENVHCLALTQAIRSSESFENKLINLRLACSAINELELQPGEIFSFWILVGRPSQRRGYRPSRNIVKGQLSQEVGGGLCQVSGIIYHLALTAGLEVRERHSHSIDIYTEAERIAPLGADATVVYGYKDLRLVNPFHFPIVFSFECLHSELTFSIFSPEIIAPKDIAFRRERVGGLEKVETLEMNNESVLNVLAFSTYGKL